MLFKKAQGPVVVMALMILVVVVGISSFSTWYETFESGVFVKAETQSKESGLKLHGLFKTSDDLGYLYLQSVSGYLFVDKVEFGDEECNLTSSYVVDETLTKVGLGCDFIKGNKEVVIYTSGGIYEKDYFIK